LRAEAAALPKLRSLTNTEKLERRQVVDELGKLESDASKVRASEPRIKALKAEVKSWADSEYPAHQAVVFEGNHYSAQVSAKGKLRRFRSMEALFDLLGKAKFLAHCAFTLKSAEEQLSPVDLGRVVVEEPNAGERTVKAVLRAGKAA
jgi:hypothetical protein